MEYHNRNKPLVIIVGPTAVGKTETSINIAKKLEGEIISADSMQVYKFMDIGSAKPTLEERQGIPHYLMDEIDPRIHFSVAEFQEKALQHIDDIISRHKLPIIVGGTGLYVNSIIYDLDFSGTPSNWAFRSKLEEETKRFGNDYLHDKLKQIDMKLAMKIHPNNIKKIIRALEIFEDSGEIMKDFRGSLVENIKFDYVLIGLIRNREELYRRINSRADQLIKKGLIDEVKGLIALGLDDQDISMKGLGYKEIIKYLKGEYTLEETVEILKKDTRRYAKRQITWFKRYEKIKWFSFDEYDTINELENNIIQYIEGYFRIV